MKEEEIPQQWQKGIVKRLYKGKGVKGKCSSERGITLASNFGKLFERIINNRIYNLINVTENQAGGRKHKATADHLLIMKEIRQLSKKSNQTLLKNSCKNFCHNCNFDNKTFSELLF